MADRRHGGCGMKRKPGKVYEEYEKLGKVYGQKRNRGEKEL